MVGLHEFEFPGSYGDQRGVDAVTWKVCPSTRPGWQRRYEIRSTIRGIDVWGADWEVLGPDEPIGAAAEALNLNAAGDLDDCVLRGDLPCQLDSAGGTRPVVVSFTLDLRRDVLRSPARPENLQLQIAIDGRETAVTDEWFEEGVQRLEAALPAGIRLSCCVTCLYSDYSPGGHGLMGMQCHRDAKAQYLQVRSKGDYWHVPVTEEVPETYICPEYERRVPGTGYRG